jgi:hypothetical protein
MGRWVLQVRLARRTVGPACGLCLALGLLTLAAGCGQNKKKEPPYAEVSGTVFYKGKPLPGGEVTFVNEGGFVGNATIDENGKYSVKAPTGPVKISVDNGMLQPPGAAAAGRGRGPSPPKTMPGLKRPDSEPPKKMPGKYVPIPQKYANPEESGLTHTVTSGSQTFDIKLE